MMVASQCFRFLKHLNMLENLSLLGKNIRIRKYKEKLYKIQNKKNQGKIIKLSQTKSYESDFRDPDIGGSTEHVFN